MKTTLPYHPSSHRQSAFTLIELLVVITIIAILASLAFPAARGIMERSYRLKTQTAVKDLQVAINGYLTEYNRLPVQPGGTTGETPLLTDSSTTLISVLLAEESGTGTLNPRGIVFLNAPTAKNGKGGLTEKGSSVELVDQWGKPYQVLLDTNFDNKIVNPDASNEDKSISQDAPPNLRTRVAVFSLGKDGKENTRDDVVSWR